MQCFCHRFTRTQRNNIHSFWLLHTNNIYHLQLQVYYLFIGKYCHFYSFFLYSPIWKLACTRVSNQRRAVQQTTQNVQTRLAVIMSATVLEFFIFQIPMCCVILTTIYQQVAGSLLIQSDMAAVGFALWCVDSIINPLWTTFLSSKKSNSVSIFNLKSPWPFNNKALPPKF